VSDGLLNERGGVYGEDDIAEGSGEEIGSLRLPSGQKVYKFLSNLRVGFPL